MSEELPGDRKLTPPALGAMPAWAVDLMLGLKGIQERLISMDANIDLQGDTVRDVAKRMTALEERQNALETRTNTHSERAKGVADVNAEQDDRLKRLEEKVDAIHSAVVGVVNNPKVRAFARLLFVLAMTYAAAKGIKVLP